ncbi:Exosome non-catalytic core component [Agyrium rufum]|nr:Exosome non-catalytic core component [Agyrium rufum]
MPLDTSIYSLAHLRLDGRRWNELRHLSASISTQPSASGSSLLTLGNTRVLCTVTGPTEAPRRAASTSNTGADANASIAVEVVVAPFATTDRKRRGKGDKRISELQMTIGNTFQAALLTHLYPHSQITISLTVLALDGALLAACLNAATLALVDAGIPMLDYVCACTAGSCPTNLSLGSGGGGGGGRGGKTVGGDVQADPLLDLNEQEELELPFLTVATLGPTEQVCTLIMETKVSIDRVEGMMAAAVDGCKQVKDILDDVVRERGKVMLEGGG